MNGTAWQILQHLRDRLRSSELFAAVTLGLDPSSTVCPRVEIVLAALEQRPCDDLPQGNWLCLRAQLRLLTRQGQGSDGQERALSLAEQAQQTLLADSYCGGLCQDSPLGRAMELGSLSRLPDKPPVDALAFEIRCHYLQEDLA
jgi:hypothetical protein